MASAKKISELTTAGPLQGPELVPVVQIGATLQTTVSAIAIFATSAVSSDVAAVSTRLDQVSARVSVNSAAITSINAVVSALDTRVTNVSASVSALQVQLDSVSAALTSTNNVVSALEVRVSNASAAIVSTNAVVANVSALVSALDIRVAAVSASVSALQIQLNNVSAALTSTNNVVSALEVRVSSVSAAVSVNAAAITSINAVVSTKVNRFGDFMDNVQYIEFNTSTSIPTSAGRLSWSIEEGTLDIGFDNQGVVLHTGLQLYQRVYNNTAATLTKGTVIRVTGSQGQRLTAAPALANNDINSATTFAVMAENVSVNNAGFALTEGVLKNVNTHTIPDGTTLWLSPTSAGEYTPTKPVAPQHLVLLGFVVKGNSTGAGSIYVKIINGFELGELHDVKVSSSTSLANGEVLAYDTSAGVWTNSPALINAQASISALNIQVAAVSALTSVNAASITSTNNVVSALEIRVSTVSAAVSALDVRVAAVSASVSALNVQMVQVLASISAINSVLATIDTAAITSINNVVSALEVRVSAVSAAVSAAFVSIGQRVLKAGDTITGQLAIAVAANTIGVSVSGGLVVTSVVNFTGNSALLLQSGTTATRPGSPTPGQIRFNSGSNTFEGYVSAEWGAIGGGGGATGGGNDQIFFLNDQVVSVSYSIPAGKNAGTFGPITVAAGVTVVVPTSSVWTIV